MSTRRITPRQNPNETDRNATDEDPTLLLPARDTRRQLWVGLFVLVGILATLLALFTLTDPATFRGRYMVHTTVANAGGLRKGDPVQLRGVNIGRVRRFHITDTGVEIDLELEGEYDVPKDSRMELESGGLLGGMTATIVPGRSSEDLKDGDVIPGVSGGGAFDVSGVTSRADSVLVRVQHVLNDRNLSSIDRTMVNVDQSAAQLSSALRTTSALVTEQRTQLRSLMTSLNAAAVGVRNATGPELAQSTQRLNRVTLQMDSAVTRLNSSTVALNDILGRINRGEGTLGKLTRDEQLYTSMVETVNSLKSLSEDIKANPRKYINLSIF